MGGVRVVTDSTADLGPLAAAHGVAVVPLSVTFGEDTFEDGVTIDSPTFFARLSDGRQRPTTSQPAPGAFEACFRRAFAEGADAVVAIQVSARLSGTYQTALAVAETLRAEGAHIEVLDSAQASLGMHFGVLAASRAAREGADAGQVAAAARDALERSRVYLVADDLEYLRRGGRIGQAQRVVGTLLNVKPIITLRGGGVVALESPRTRRRAYERLAEYAREQAPLEGVIVGQSSPALGDELEAAVRQAYAAPIHRMWAGPTIGTHVGPGAVGMALLRAR